MASVRELAALSAYFAAVELAKAVEGRTRLDPPGAKANTAEQHPLKMVIGPVLEYGRTAMGAGLQGDSDERAHDPKGADVEGGTGPLLSRAECFY